MLPVLQAGGKSLVKFFSVFALAPRGAAVRGISGCKAI